MPQPARVLGESVVSAAIDAAGLRDQWNRLEDLQLIDWPAVATLRYKLWRYLYEQFTRTAHSLSQDLYPLLPGERRNPGAALPLRSVAGQRCLLQAQPADWRQWSEQYRNPGSSAVHDLAQAHRHEIDFHAFCQWLVACSLERVQSVARSSGMRYRPDCRSGGRR